MSTKYLKDRLRAGRIAFLSDVPRDKNPYKSRFSIQAWNDGWDLEKTVWNARKAAVEYSKRVLVEQDIDRVRI